MPRHSHSRRPSEEYNPAPIPSASTIPRPKPDQTRLPSLSEVIPEIGWTHPPAANIADYRRELYHHPPGPAHYHKTAPITSPSLPTSRSMPRPTLEIPEPSPIGSTRRLPIHSGPTNRNSGSSSSSDFSSNRRTTNTSPSVSPVYPSQSSASRETRSDKPRQIKIEAPPTPGLPSGMPSPYATYSGQGQLPVHYGTCGYEQPQPYRPRGPSYPQSMPATPSGPVFKVEAPPYGGFAAPLDMPGYPGPNGQPLYIDNFQPPEGERRSKKRRGNLPKWQTDFMRAWYNDHVDNPYPTDEEKHMIMRETGLTLEQVANWFINCRRRHGPEMTRQAQAESNLRRAHGQSSHGASQESPSRRREAFTKSEPR